MGAKLVASALFSALLFAGGLALAEDDPEADAQDAIEEAQTKYLETDFADAELILRDALQECAEICSDEVRTRLYVVLASVVGTGEQRIEDAKDAFVEALRIDPKAKPDDDMTSDELVFAWKRARTQLGLDDEGDDDDDEDDDDDDVEETPPPPAEEPRRNWIRLSFVPDISLLTSQNDVCTQENQEQKSWVCTRQDESRYLGQPQIGERDAIGTGVALSTIRILLAYDRLIADNFTIGLRGGVALLGADEGDAKFVPAHVEARFGYWFGASPFLDVVRPHVFVAAGFAQIDTKRTVRVVEDQAACGASSAAANDCTNITDPNRDSPERPRKQDLTAFKQAGPGFLGLGFGIGFSPTPLITLDVGVRASITFPVFSPVFSPEGGISFGF